MQDFSQIICRAIIFFLAVSVIGISSRPSHFENNQLISDSDTNQLYDSGLKPWQMELLAQRLAEWNQLGNDYGYERSLRSDNERKRRYRPNTCFFNPVSCFKKK